MERPDARTAARPIVLASRNAHKVKELRALLAPYGLNVVDLRDIGLPELPEEDAIEVGDTFEANALAKARYYRARIGGDAPVVSDDSGLVVHALGGAPGIHSRRYAGAGGSDAEVSAANTAKLLTAMGDTQERGAEFVCAVAYAAPGDEHVVTGRTPGRILHQPVGAEGFGYDPVFWSDELGRSFGEATAAEKARVSHRGRALRVLAEFLRRREAAGSR